MTNEETGQLLGAGKMAEVVAHGAHALKLYRTGGKQNVFREAATLALLETLDVPAPRVETAGRFEGRWGLLMSRVSGRTFGDIVTGAPQELRRYLGAMVELHRGIHRHHLPGLGSLKARLRGRLAASAALAEASRRRLLDRLAELPDGDRLCHGDFHPYNVLGEPGNAVVVDWLDATSGAPAADLCRSYLLISHYSQELAQAYVEAYLAAEVDLAAEAVFAWLPVLAAARLAENVPEETDRLVALAEAG